MFTILQCHLNFKVCRRPKMTKKTLLSLSSGHIRMKDAQCAETNEKRLSDFYFSSYLENSSKIENL